jgi:tetratricopeptide (TPR) repeat protein
LGLIGPTNVRQSLQQKNVKKIIFAIAICLFVLQKRGKSMGKYLQALFFAYFYPLNGSFLFATEDDIASSDQPEYRKGTRKGTTENSKQTMYKRFILFTFLMISLPTLLSGQQSTAQQLVDEGVALHDQGEYEKAMAKYREALAHDPGLMQAVYEMSLTSLEMEDYAGAEKYSSEVINSDDEKLGPGACAVKSEALMKTDRSEDAIALLQEGLKRYGEGYLLHFNLALNYYKSGEQEKALLHVSRAIDLDKSQSGAFLLNAYLLKDSGLWVQSILSFQMFLLLEPDSERSKNAFEEMLQTMSIRERAEPVQRSFIQQQMIRNRPAQTQQAEAIPPLTPEDGLDRGLVYKAIQATLDSLQTGDDEADPFLLFSSVNRSIMKVLEAESIGPKEGILWTYYIPFFTHIEQSDYYETYCRYISVSYYPESLQWWQENEEAAGDFVRWFENGDAIRAGSKK